MNNSNMFGMLALAALGVATFPTSALAKQNKFEKELVGTWFNTSNNDKDASGAPAEAFGSHPVGAYMFDSNGYVLQVIVPSDESAAKAYVATIGKYSVTDGGKTLVIHYIASGTPKRAGTESKRTITSLTNDELKIYNVNAATIGGIDTVDRVWTRAK